jgi:selenocysteine lyase/cysteine desulfurase
MSDTALPVALVGDTLPVPCADGTDRPHLPFDAASATGALPQVLDAVEAFLPWYSSADHGAGYKTQASILAYESARLTALAFAGRGPDSGDIAVICQNATGAIHYLACQLKLGSGDVVVTTVAEHHANLLPWSRAATCRYVECGQDGTFEPADVAAVLDQRPVPRLLAITGASHVTGWLPPLPEIIAAAHHRGIPVLVDAAQLAPHRPLPAGADFLAWSGHKMYAPFGAGVLVGPRQVLAARDTFGAGGGAAPVPGLDEVARMAPQEREEPGSPNVIGAVALGAAISALEHIGWPAVISHDRRIARSLRRGLTAIPGVRLRGPGTDTETLPVATFTVDGIPSALIAARLAAEDAIEVRHGCLHARPYLTRLLGPGPAEARVSTGQVRTGSHSSLPGAIRASAGINTSEGDVARLLRAVERLVSTEPPVRYRRDPSTGDFYPASPAPEPVST